MQKLSLPLLALLFALDQVDGYIARKTDSVTKIGAMIDIMVDRIVELILWIAFAFLTFGETFPLVPLWIPFVFITRGIITDTIRSEAYRKDITPYEMITSKLGRILVSSHISRGIYAVLKALTFCYVIAIYAFEEAFLGLFNGVKMIGYILVYASTAYCLARGFPVIYAARDLFRG